MRPSCLACVLKHLAQSIVLLGEARLGYPTFLWLAIGHLAEAETEALERHPDLAGEIRELRKALEDDPTVNLPLMELVERVDALWRDERLVAHSTSLDVRAEIDGMAAEERGEDVAKRETAILTAPLPAAGHHKTEVIPQKTAGEIADRLDRVSKRTGGLMAIDPSQEAGALAEEAARERTQAAPRAADAMDTELGREGEA